MLLSSCFAIETSREYNKDMTKGSSTSEPIYLSFVNTKDGSFYFILQKNINAEKYTMHVRWVCRKQEGQFNGTNSSLKFLVDSEDIISLFPALPPKVASYNIEDGSFEEDAMYSISLEDLKKITSAKKVIVELTGKYNKVIIGHFNKFHTFRAFKEFLVNS